MLCLTKIKKSIFTKYFWRKTIKKWNIWWCMCFLTTTRNWFLWNNRSCFVLRWKKWNSRTWLMLWWPFAVSCTITYLKKHLFYSKFTKASNKIFYFILIRQTFGEVRKDSWLVWLAVVGEEQWLLCCVRLLCEWKWLFWALVTVLVLLLLADLWNRIIKYVQWYA